MAQIAVVTKKRSVLKGQMTNLRAAVDRGELNATNVRMRVQRLTELFHQYEDLHAELEENEENNAILAEVQDTFYDLISSIAETPAAGTSRGNPNLSHLLSGFANSTVIEKQKSVKLPVAELPKFDGNYENWLSFKNTFKSMIDARTDIDDLNKFIYLKNSLTGNAAKKLSLFDASPENYKRGWDLLTRLYEKKRILITNHYAAFFDNGYCKITPMSTASPEALSKLVDEARQHKGSLESLGIVPDEGMMVSFLEKALPVEVRGEWERTLNSDSMPSFDQFDTFIHEYITRLVTLKQGSARPRGGQAERRAGDQYPRPAKARKIETGTRTFVTNTSITCAHCKQNHPVYKCPEFDKLNLQQRWDAVRAAAVCRNCLSNHKGACKSTHCKRCNKFHHTLLHNDSSSANKVATNKSTGGGTA